MQWRCGQLLREAYVQLAYCKSYVHPVLIMTLNGRDIVSMSVYCNFGTFDSC